MHPSVAFYEKLCTANFSSVNSKEFRAIFISDEQQKKCIDLYVEISYCYIKPDLRCEIYIIETSCYLLDININYLHCNVDIDVSSRIMQNTLNDIFNHEFSNFDQNKLFILTNPYYNNTNDRYYKQLYIAYFYLKELGIYTTSYLKHITTNIKNITKYEFIPLNIRNIVKNVFFTIIKYTGLYFLDFCKILYSFILFTNIDLKGVSYIIDVFFIIFKIEFDQKIDNQWIYKL
jgi:hypothetical protein